MVHDLQSIDVAIQIIKILGTETRRQNMCLHVFLQCGKDIRFNGKTMIDCCNVYDFCIRTSDPNIMMGGPNIHVTAQHPLLWINQPHCSLRIIASEEVAKWTGQAAELGMAALYAHHLEAVGEFIPFHPASYFRPGPSGLAMYGPRQLMEGYAKILIGLGFHPKVEQVDPHGQAIPGGDGAIFDPPLKLHLLLMDRSWVIADGFHVQEVTAEQKRPPSANQN